MRQKVLWAMVVALLVGVTSAWSYKGMMMEKKDTMIIEELRSLNRLYNNFSRDIEEYDTTKDTSPDTLQWSWEKTILESRKLLEPLLAQREILRGEECDQLIYQGAVERWDFNLKRCDNQYQVLLQVIRQFGSMDDQFIPLLEEELLKALSLRYYPEALQVVRWTSQGDAERLQQIRPQFVDTPEGALIDMWLLQKRLDQELLPIEQKMFEKGGEAWDAEWAELVASLMQDGMTICRKLQATPYHSEARSIYRQYFGTRRASLTATITDVATGQVEVKVSGIFAEELPLMREDMVVGQIPSGVVRLALNDYLPAVGLYKYIGKGSHLYDYVTYEQAKVYCHTLQDHFTQIEVLSRITGDPVPRVRLELIDNNRKIISSTATDAEGRAHFKSRKEAYWVRVKDPKLAEAYEYLVPPLPSTPEDRDYQTVSFYTDRPLYRRGQEVKAGLVLSETKGEETKVVPHASLKVSLQANRSFETIAIESKEVETNQHGIAEVTFMLPEEEDLTHFYLTTSLGQYYLEVQDYKRSYLSIQLDSIPTGYVKGKVMKLFGHTTDLNGLPTPATVQLKYGSNQRIEVSSGSDGNFIITTPVITPKGEGRRLELTASDALGNTAKLVKYLPSLPTDMPLEAGSLLGNVDNVNKESFALFTTSQPYNHRCLGDLSGRSVFAQLVNETDTIALGELPLDGEKQFSLPDLPSGKYRMRLSTVDGYGVSQHDASYRSYYFYGPDDTELIGNELLWAERLPNGQLLFGSSRHSTIILMLQHQGKVVYKEYIKAQAGRLYRHTLPEMEADAIQLYSLSGMEEGSRTIEIPKAEVSKQSTHFEGLAFEQPLRPGSELQKQIKVYAKSGRPLLGVPVIATVYDKAVDDAAEALGVDFWDQYLGGDFDEPIYFGSPLRTTMVEAAPMAMKNASADMSEESLADDATPRANFAETAFFSALLVTDEAGAIDLSFTLPDTQTKYITRLYAFTPDFEEEVMDEATLEVYSPLSIELSTPRFLTWGDRLEGEALIRNAEKVGRAVRYQIGEEDKLLAEGEVEVPAEGVVMVRFATTAPECSELTLRAEVVSGNLRDAVERVIPLQSNLSTYVVAQPLSLYKQSRVTLTLPKMEAASSDLTLQLYLDPLQLLLSKLAISHRESAEVPKELFATLHYYIVYSRLHDYLQNHPEWANRLAADAEKLQKIEHKPANWGDRMADPQTLAQFYRFITDEQGLSSRLRAMEQQIQRHAVVGGGFRYSRHQLDASPWLTHYILDKLGGLHVVNADLQKSLFASLPYLVAKLQEPNCHYGDYVGFALIAHQYQYTLPHDADFAHNLKRQVEQLREVYRWSDNSTMLRFAHYSRAYDSPEAYAEVRKFVWDRSQYTQDDDEKLAMMLFLNKEEEGVPAELVKFILETKQNTIWYDQAIVQIATHILGALRPTTISPQATLTINGTPYKFTHEEQITGAISLRYPANQDSLSLSWSELESDYLFGGLSYSVTQPSAQVTPTGDKLKVEKQVYVRQVDAQGGQTFALAKEVKKGDKLIVRYLIETAQDLSLVVLLDPRPATSEFGYDFEGFRFTDLFWYDYSRRDTHDRIYLDYLPRGRHQIEMEAIATQSGQFIYGPAQIQSYYAPEYVANSSGGSLTIQ